MSGGDVIVSNFEHAAEHLAGRLTLEPTPGELEDASNLILRLLADRRRQQELEEALRAIRDYEPREVVKDAFAYDRIVESYRDAARAVLDRKGNET